MPHSSSAALASPLRTRGIRLAVAGLALVCASLAAAQPVDPKLFDGLEWRLVGPFRGGRSLAVAGSVQRPKEYYFGATGGGIWKTNDGGQSWNPVSDGFLTSSSVGALAVAPSDPNIVVAGTGERDIRGNISEGDGVYRTTDGGKTWSHIGLRDTRTISRVVIHPTNPDVIYVAALGRVYGKANLERGVYKTTDAGKTWTKILAGSVGAGAVDLDLDPKNPEVVVASLWEAYRTPYSMTSGGPGSKLLKSTDGGKTWADLSRNPGLPSGLLGKIGVTISPVDTNRWYAIVEAAEGGIFRSDDAGATWTRVNEDRNWRQRAWYYSHVHADPKNKDGVYVLNVGMAKSTDGGKTFSGIGAPHSDHHDLWIAPDDPNRLINANDGGANVSTDGGRTWTEQTFPTAQFYHVSTDNSFPYRILGAQQDNSTVRIASRTQGNGIGKADWTSTAGGESGYVTPKPNDPDIVYGGSYGGDLSMLNHRTGLSRQVDPWPDNPIGHGGIDLVQRFQWTFPIVFSPHDPNVLYTCSQFVLKSTNGGTSWKKISPDLTRNDPATMGSSGGPITKDNTGVEIYGTVFTLAESPKRKGLLWAGSDDGLIYVSLNGGGSWKDVTAAQMPKWGLVSMIEASPHDPQVAFAAVDNHENDDYSPYIYITRDGGTTWKKAVSGIPATTFVRVVREDPKRKGLLYAGTETGIYVSFDAGENWQSLQLNLPLSPVHDLVWKEDDLVVATHGRSFWVLDDVSPLRQVEPGEKAGSFKLFAPRDAYRVRWGGGGGGRRGRSTSTEQVGSNPPSGVIVNYYLPADAKEVKIEFLDRSGKVVTTTTGPTSAGFRRTTAWVQTPSYRPVPGMIFWAAFPSPITVPPGEYTVRVTADSKSQVAKFRWVKDPRTPATDADLVAQYELFKQIADKVTEANNAVLTCRTLRGKLQALAASESVTKVISGVTEVEEAIYQTKMKSGQDPLNYPIRINNRLAALLGVVQSGDFGPTESAREVFKRLVAELKEQTERLKKLEAEATKLGVK